MFKRHDAYSSRFVAKKNSEQITTPDLKKEKERDQTITPRGQVSCVLEGKDLTRFLLQAAASNEAQIRMWQDVRPSVG
jgi:hypothetical protein